MLSKYIFQESSLQKYERYQLWYRRNRGSHGDCILIILLLLLLWIYFEALLKFLDENASVSCRNKTTIWIVKKNLSILVLFPEQILKNVCYKIEIKYIILWLNLRWMLNYNNSISFLLYSSRVPSPVRILTVKYLRYKLEKRSNLPLNIAKEAQKHKG